MSESTSSSFTDIRRGDWVDRRMPAAFRPYCRLARLDRPIGSWLLLLPCWWGLALAAPPGAWPHLRLILLFALGAVVMRGAGCTVNDIIDRDFDRRVARTASRPIPSGAITLPYAFLFLALQLAVGLLILLQLGRLAIWLGAGSLLLVAAYPFMKRFTYWPQAVLGLTFNWGALLAPAAVLGRIPPAAFALYAAGFAWTLVYDTIYAHQDKEDDLLVGVRSTALKFGGASRSWLGLFALVMLALLALAFALAGLGFWAWLSLSAVALHLLWQIVHRRHGFAGRLPGQVPRQPMARPHPLRRHSPGSPLRVTDPAAFVRGETVVGAAPLVPEIRLHLASEVVALWQATEEDLARQGLPPPYWAFAWPGGQAIARHIIDNPALVRGRRVLDFAAGSGLAAIAAAKAGAASVAAAEIDAFALARHRPQCRAQRRHDQDHRGRPPRRGFRLGRGHRRRRLLRTSHGRAGRRAGSRLWLRQERMS